MAYRRPRNPRSLSKREKLELIREYVKHYGGLAEVDPASLNRKLPREAFAQLLDKIGELLITESARLAKTRGPVRNFLTANPLPAGMSDLLPNGFRSFCLALNSLKQWVAAEQLATDRYVMGGISRQLCREAIENCLVTGQVLSNDAELHHPVRDGRPPILLSKAGHQRIEAQLSKSESDPIETALRQVREERNQSWLQLRRGCSELLGETVLSSSKNTAANARAFARKAVRTTGLSLQEIVAWLDAKGL